jgi:hypothetical protein
VLFGVAGNYPRRAGHGGMEWAIHQRFAHLRLGRTERFRPEPELTEFVGSPTWEGMPPVEDEVPPNPLATAKIAWKVFRNVKVAARNRGMSISKYLSVTLAPIVNADLEREMSRELEVIDNGKGKP